MAQIAVVAHVRVQEGMSEEFLAAFTPLLDQAEKEPGTLLYLVQRSKDDAHVFWTSEVYADEAAFEAHAASEVHAAAMPVVTELIVESEVTVGEALMGKGLAG